MDEHFAGLEQVWCWVAPHPSDPRPSKPDHAVSRLGTGSPDEGFVPFVELRSKRTRNAERDWASSIHDVTGRSAKKVGTFGLECLGHAGKPPHSCSIRLTKGANIRAWWQWTGEFQVQRERTTCSMATRGAPVPDRSGEGFLSRLLRQEPSVTVPPDVVDDELECFDGWLRARQHRTPVDDGFAEAWRIDIDHRRARPVSLVVTLIAACTSLCQRPASMRLP